MPNKTPVLFLIFNRPDTTRRVFEVIRKYKPTQLFIAADGPRIDKEGEKERCEEVRKITESVDWPCNVKRLYREKNLGCKFAVSGAINWFFKNVEEGIILEDDCLPSLSFFSYCEVMLNLYRSDDKVMCISGDNFLPLDIQMKNKYFFSKYIHIWGWATWRRVWESYDVEMKDWLKIKDSNMLSRYFNNLAEKTYWKTIFDAVYEGKIDTWDYQFVYHVWKNNGISIMPNRNLVSNIGFAKDALHTKSSRSNLSNLKTYDIKFFPKKLPFIWNNKADDFSRKYVFRINIINVFKQWLYYKFAK